MLKPKAVLVVLHDVDYGCRSGLEGWLLLQSVNIGIEIPASLRTDSLSVIRLYFSIIYIGVMLQLLLSEDS